MALMNIWIFFLVGFSSLGADSKSALEEPIAKERQDLPIESRFPVRPAFDRQNDSHINTSSDVTTDSPNRITSASKWWVSTDSPRKRNESHWWQTTNSYKTTSTSHPWWWTTSITSAPWWTTSSPFTRWKTSVTGAPWWTTSSPFTRWKTSVTGAPWWTTSSPFTGWETSSGTSSPWRSSVTTPRPSITTTTLQPPTPLPPPCIPGSLKNYFFVLCQNCNVSSQIKINDKN